MNEQLNEHLNIFCPYNADKKKIYCENNVTRASLITFGKMQLKEKIIFVNKLTKKHLIEEDDNCEFELYLQTGADYSNYEKKFLVGFCPSGKVESISEMDKIVDCIIESTNNHDAIVDMAISVKKNGKSYCIIAFENKFEDLYFSQLKRHFNNILGIKKREDIRESLLLLDYISFFNLFKETKGDLNNDLLDYLNISGKLYPSNFKELNRMKYKIKENAGYLLGKVLDKIVVDGKRKRQSGWGEIIDVGGINDCIKMIGLVYNWEGKIELQIRFGSTMKSARVLFSRIKNGINLNDSFTSEFHLNYIRGYIENSIIQFPNINKYIDFFKSYELKQCDLNQLKKLIKDVSNYVGYCFDEKKYCFNDKRLTHGRINICPSIVFKKIWDIEELERISFDSFVGMIKDTINDCQSMIGININY